MAVKPIRPLSTSPWGTLRLVLGLAVSPGWSSDDDRSWLDELLREADDALCSASAAGSNRVDLAA